MSPLRYLLDENVDPVYAGELMRRDTDLVVWCEVHGFVLVTNNRKSVPAHLQDHLASGRHVPGIILLNPVMSVGATLDDLWLIATAAEEAEYRDRIAYLPV